MMQPHRANIVYAAFSLQPHELALVFVGLQKLFAHSLIELLFCWEAHMFNKVGSVRSYSLLADPDRY